MSKNLDDISVGELIDLLKRKSNKGNTKNLDILKENNILKIKVNCTDCKKFFYHEFELDKHSCPECHKKFTDKIDARVEQMKKEGKYSGAFDRLIIAIQISEEEKTKNDKQIHS